MISTTLLVIILAVFLVIVAFIFIYEMHKESLPKVSALFKMIGTLISDLFNWQNTFPYWV